MTEPNSPREAVEQHRAQLAQVRSEQFKVGDIVVLRSGGPRMTVWRVLSVPSRAVETEWFAGDELKRDAFSQAELEHAPPKETP